jgi:amino acid adenylation domain-containing protein
MNTLDSWFRRTARRYPDRPALEVGQERLSYAQLDDLAERLSTAYVDAVGGNPHVVGILCARSVAAYAGYLAALRAGATVVPLNPQFPAARNVAICKAARVDLIVVDDTGAPHADDVLAATTAATVRLTGPSWWLDTRPVAPAADRRHRARPDDVAYVLFTSGSTGRPKGVPIRHRQLAEYLAFCVQRYDVGPGSRLSQAFDLTFDPSVFDMFVTWYGGGTLVVPQPGELLKPARFIVERRISHWFSVPSVISLADRLHGLTPGSMPDLCWSLFAGEQLTLDQARVWAAAAPGSTIENLYGPTELTITCTGYRLPRHVGQWPRTSNGTVPIGRPYPHLEALVVPDGDGGANGEGELCLRGSQRFDGYVEPADNAGRFLRSGPPAAVPDTQWEQDWYRTGDRVRWQDGELVHLGRVDDQLKIGGYRVEPGEIECVLREHPSVHEAVVLGVQGSADRNELYAFYTGDGESERAVLAHAQRRLPAYLVPARLVHVPRFPTNANGKIDRRRLGVRDLYAGTAVLSL